MCVFLRGFAWPIVQKKPRKLAFSLKPIASHITCVIPTGFSPDDLSINISKSYRSKLGYHFGCTIKLGQKKQWSISRGPIIPKHSMYGIRYIYLYMFHKNPLNVGRYTIHGYYDIICRPPQKNTPLIRSKGRVFTPKVPPLRLPTARNPHVANWVTLTVWQWWAGRVGATLDWKNLSILSCLYVCLLTKNQLASFSSSF